mgnify:CR=1 FL=1
MSISDVVIVDGVRTAIGGFGGSLSTLTPAELGTAAAAEVIKRTGVDPQNIDHSVFGHIITTGPQDVYLSRHIALNVGMATSSAALNVNRLCGSSVQSVISAAQMVALGDSKMALAGGAESMSQGAYILPGARTGFRMGDSNVVDMTVSILSDPFGSGHMGITAENISQQYGLTRQDLDEYSAESHRRAAAAIANGHFEGQIVPVTVKKGRKEFVFSQDEHVRADTTVESLSGLRPAFKKDGIVTPGNASGINDGGAAMLLTTAAEAEKQGLKARARILSYGFSGVNPDVMGLGPTPAVKSAMQKAGLSVADMDVIESNEAFAAQAIAVSRDLDFDPAKVNPNGGAVGLGHPVGATGSILIIKTLAELDRIEGRYGLITMCIGGGQGIALVVERMA